MERLARKLITAPSTGLPPYKGEGFWKGTKGYIEILWNVVTRNSIYNSKKFFDGFIFDGNFEDLKTPVGVVVATSSQQAVLALTNRSMTTPEGESVFDIGEHRPEVVVEYKGKVADLVRASSSIPFLMSRHKIQFRDKFFYPTDGAVYRGLPCQFIRGKYRLALSTQAPPPKQLKQLKPDLTGWWGIGVPIQIWKSIFTMLAGVTATDISGYRNVGDGNDSTHEFYYTLECGKFREENDIKMSWLNIGGHTQPIVDKLFKWGTEEAQRWWEDNSEHHEGIREHGLVICMTGGGGDGFTQSGFIARLYDLIGVPAPFRGFTGVSAGAINAVFFARMQARLSKEREMDEH